MDTREDGIIGFVDEIEIGGDVNNWLGTTRLITDSVVGVRVGIFPILINLLNSSLIALHASEIDCTVEDASLNASGWEIPPIILSYFLQNRVV